MAATRDAKDEHIDAGSTFVVGLEHGIGVRKRHVPNAGCWAIRRYATSRFDIALTIGCLTIFFAFVPVLLFAIAPFARAERKQEVQSGIYNNVLVTAENLRSLQLRRDARRSGSRCSR